MYGKMVASMWCFDRQQTLEHGTQGELSHWELALELILGHVLLPVHLSTCPSLSQSVFASLMLRQELGPSTILSPNYVAFPYST